MAAGNASIETGRDRAAWAVVWVGVAILTLLAIYRLRDFPYHLWPTAAWAGIHPLLPVTLWAAIKVWAFWAIADLIIAGVILRLDPALELPDAILGGAAGLWVLAYLLGQALGPSGLFRGPTLWLLMLLGALWLWRNPPRVRLSAPSTGLKLALLAWGLLAVGMLPLQLASPVVPFMDVLSYPASAQRIVTFGVYLPFDNDPYGWWGPYAQTPALELFYAMLALGTHTHMAVLAESAAMVPMAGLMFLGAWALGRAVFDDTAGGIASMFLFFTCLFRRAQGMRGTAVDFALVAVALAFFLDSRRRPVLFALGALLLGTSVAWHAIDGGFAMIVAGAAIVWWFAARDWARAFAGIACLAGAILVAVPEFAIGLAHPMPYPLMPLIQMLGAAIIVIAALGIGDGAPLNWERVRWFNLAAITLLIWGILYRCALQPGSLFDQVSGHLPILLVLAMLGLIAAVCWSFMEPGAIPFCGMIAVALLLGVAEDSLDGVLRALALSASTQMMASDIGIKLWDYWLPYFLIFPAGFLLSILYKRWSKPLTLAIVMAILIYPWHHYPEPVDYDSDEHSIPEQWGFNWWTAAQGYWAGQPERHWMFGPTELAMLNVLGQEIAAGRITIDTHVLYIAQNLSVWSTVQFPVFTGINSDPIEYDHVEGNLWEGGSRVRGPRELASALAAQPPYILEQVRLPPGFKDPPDGYDVIFDGGYLKLYRRHDLSPK